MTILKAIRGMNDILPTESVKWQFLEQSVKSVLASYGYAEMRMPVVEQTQLFKRSIGEVTDIVEKEMYTFDDRNGESLTLRPEGTAGCVRAALEHGLLHNQIQRLWYLGPMYRYERPQKGRYRQFYQIGVETFGMSSADIDAELIILTHRLWTQLGIRDAVRLELNTLATPEARAKYRQALVDYLQPHFEALDEDSRRRLATNPLRILDSKVASTQEILRDAPTLSDYVDDESAAHFERLKSLLDKSGVDYVVNPKLVRGLDYYSRTVFEWITDSLGAQGTVCAGGRYDGLVEQLGGKPTPAVGFAMGVERLLLLLDTLNAFPEQIEQTIDIYAMAMGDAAELELLELCEQQRSHNPALRLLAHCGEGGFKAKMKKADRSGARFALIIGEDELAQSVVTVKDLRGELGQQSIARSELGQWLKQQFIKE